MEPRLFDGSADDPLGYRELFALFEPGPDHVERIGIEVELATLDPGTGLSVPYEGPTGVRALLESLCRSGFGEGRHEGSRLLGIQRADGSRVSLEHSGAVEFSSRPSTSLHRVVAESLEALHEIRDHARALGLALFSGGLLPFNGLHSTNWVPKDRGRIMRRYFRNRSGERAAGLHVMALTLSTQATLDYLSATDLIEKLETAVFAAPVAVALFANSPLQEGAPTGAMSRRMQIWAGADPPRCGFIPPVIEGRPGLEAFIDWAIGLPMIYRRQGSRWVESRAGSFSELLEASEDGPARARRRDWLCHLSQIYTDVRLRHTIEMRATDGPPPRYLAAVPAFWTGLLYHPPSRASARSLLGDRSPEERRAAYAAAARQGLDGRHGRDLLRDMASELVRLARQGLEARVAAGAEPAEVLSFLEPLDEVVSTGRTFASTCLARWEGELGRSPARFVRAYSL